MRKFGTMSSPPTPDSLNYFFALAFPLRRAVGAAFLRGVVRFRFAGREFDFSFAFAFPLAFAFGFGFGRVFAFAARLAGAAFFAALVTAFFVDAVLVAAFFGAGFGASAGTVT